ncbi:MAG: sensor histidine kinase [Thaumarchaeota archaeon]|nr:sensor histidine kinase [Nitrososphaerota archaeon]
MKIKTLLFVTIIPLIATSLIILSFFAIQSYSQEIENDIITDLNSIAINIMDKISRTMHERIVDITLLSSQNNQVLVGTDFSIEQKMEYLREIERTSKIYSSISIYDKNGKRIGDTRNTALGLDESEKLFFQNSIKGEIFHDPVPVFSESLKIPIIHFSGPLYDENGDIDGVLALRFSLSKINDIIKQDAIYKKPIEADLVSNEGLVIFSNHDRESILSKSYSNLPIFQLQTDSSSKSKHLFDYSEDHPDEAALFIAVKDKGFSTYQGDGWSLILEIHSKDLFAEVIKTQNNFIIFSTIITVISIVFAALISGRITNPIIDLEEATKKITRGDLNIKIELKGQKEIRDLAKSFNLMTNSLKETDQKKEEFITMISHELKTPLMPIMLNIEQLLDEKYLGKINEKQKKALMSIFNSAENLKILINDILDVNRLELGKIKLNKKEIDIQNFVNQSIEQLLPYTKEKQITINADLKTSGMIFCDSNRIFQIISNLIKNSVDFIPKKGGQITIRVEEKNDDIVFTVEDNGVGIDPKFADQLFGKFYQIDTSVTRKHGGIGLGLVICKSLVDAHGGRIWVDKSFTSGSAFKFTIPKRVNS